MLEFLATIEGLPILPIVALHVSLRSVKASCLGNPNPSFLPSLPPYFLASFPRSFVPSFPRPPAPSSPPSFLPSFLPSCLRSFLASFPPSGFLCLYFKRKAFLIRKELFCDLPSFFPSRTLACSVHTSSRKFLLIRKSFCDPEKIS